MGIEYHDDNSISMDVIFDQNVSFLSRTDFSIRKITGDDIYGMEYSLTGSGGSYKLWFCPEIGTAGSFEVDFTGSVYNSDGTMPLDVEASLDLDSQTSGIQPTVIIPYNNLQLEVDWIIPIGPQGLQFTFTAKFSKHVTNLTVDKIELLGAPEGTTKTLAQTNQREYIVSVTCPEGTDTEITPAVDLNKLTYRIPPTSILEKLDETFTLADNGQREIEFTFTDGVPSIVGNTAGVVKFFSSETSSSTDTINSVPGGTGTLQSDSVVFNSDGTAVATVILPDVDADTLIYAEIEITVDTVVYSTGRFSIIIEDT